MTTSHAAAKAPAPGDDRCSEAPRGAGWALAAGRARSLAWLSLAWMTVEGALGLAAGYRSGSSSLVGWAFGSVIEAAASAAVIWRFSGARTGSAVSERRAQRVVAVSFWVLAPYIAVLAALEVVAGRPPATSLLGVALAVAAWSVREGVQAWRGADCC